MDNDYYTGLIIKFFVDEISDEDKRILMAWVTESNENYSFFKEYEGLFDKTALYKHAINEHNAFDRLEERINKTDPADNLKYTATSKIDSSLPNTKAAGRPTKKKNTVLVSVALILFLSIGTVLSLLIWQRHHAMLRQPDQIASSKEVPIEVVETPLGRKATVTLPDGTLVIMNGGSRIEFSGSFAKESRLVRLNGEAYFDVTSFKDHPFSIQTDDLELQVLGTSFNVKAYEEDNERVVHLISGKLAVNSRNEKGEDRLLGVLKPQEKLNYNKMTEAYRVRHFQDEDPLSWRKNKLSFDNAKLETIGKELSRMYGTEIIFLNKQLKDTRYSATFRENTALMEVVKVLAATDPFEYRFKGNRLELY